MPSLHKNPYLSLIYLFIFPVTQANDQTFDVSKISKKLDVAPLLCSSKYYV